MSEVIVGTRGSGKTLSLIKKSADTGIYILVANKNRAAYVFSEARKLGLSIPYPVTIEEYFKGNKFIGSSIERDGIYVDDVDDVFKAIFRDIDIKAVTLTKNPEDKWQKLYTREGEWIFGVIGDDISSLYPTSYCSVCKTPSIFSRPNYCPHCGAKMKNPFGGKE